MYIEESDCELDDFTALIDDTLTQSAVPNAAEIISNVPVYDMPSLQSKLGNPTDRKRLMAEWSDVLMNRSGVVVLRKTYADTTVIDDASLIYLNLINEEKTANTEKSDHFAAAGSNDRLWNSPQKLAGANPQVFTQYVANPAIHAICESWLGPNYQMTAQINLVYPGGQAQQPHRDYHLGFQSNASCEQYPSHVHALSPALTLQGAVAHCDMSADNGVTQFLPFSQRYLPGYLAYRQDAFKQCFNENYVQVPLQKGDSVFFNPALFHAAGENKSADVNRLANLLQVSSAFGRAMESLDRQAMCRWVFPALKQAVKTQQLSQMELEAVIAATAEGYAFPTNLDTDPPVGGLASESQQQLLKRCLVDGVSEVDFVHALDALSNKKRALC